MALVQEWYLLLSQVSAVLGTPIRALAAGVDLPLASALLLGLLGATAPCQLTTGLSAVAYVSRDPVARQPLKEAVAYAAGKALVYSVLGGMALWLGWEAQQAMTGVAAIARRLLGPLMVLVGLMLLGAPRRRFQLGHALAHRLTRRIPKAGGVSGSLLMGMAFGFAFCPTLFLLFFGLTLPLVVRSSAGLLVPALFAVGTTLPLLAYGALLSAGAEDAQRLAGRLARAHPYFRTLAAGISILVGLHDTLVYWVL